MGLVRVFNLIHSNIAFRAVDVIDLVVFLTQSFRAGIGPPMSLQLSRNPSGYQQSIATTALLKSDLIFLNLQPFRLQITTAFWATLLSTCFD